jgi:hypothetical protein
MSISPGSSILQDGLMAMSVRALFDGELVAQRSVLSPVHSQVPLRDWSTPNPTDSQMTQNWTGGLNMLSLISSAPTTALCSGNSGLFGVSSSVCPSADLSGAVSEVGQKVHAFILKRRQDLASRIAGDLTGTLSQVAGELDGIKTVMNDYLQVALPRSWAKNDYLRVLVTGEEQIFGSASLGSYIGAGISNENVSSVAQLQAEFTKRADALEAELSKISAVSGGNQPLPVLQSALDRLQDMKNDLKASEPSRSITDVMNEIAQKAAGL